MIAARHSVAAAPALTRRAPDAHSIAEGALFADLTILIVLIGLYVPYAGPAMAAISPLPLLLLALRRGWRVTTEATIVSCLLVAFLAGPFSALPVLTIAFRSTALGIGMRKRWKAGRTVLAGTAFLWAIVCVGVTATALLMPSWRTATEQGISLTYRQITGLFGTLLRLLGQGHVWTQVHPHLTDFLAWFIAHWLLLLPLVSIPVLIVAVAAEYVIAEVVLPRFGFAPAPLRLFGMQATPEAGQPKQGVRRRVRERLEAQLVLRQEQLRERRELQRARGKRVAMEPVPSRTEPPVTAAHAHRPPDGSGD